MSECRLIIQSMIPLSVNFVASKSLSLYAVPTLDINFDNLQASRYKKLIIILLNSLH